MALQIYQLDIFCMRNNWAACYILTEQFHWKWQSNLQIASLSAKLALGSGGPPSSMRSVLERITRIDFLPTPPLLPLLLLLSWSLTRDCCRPDLGLLSACTTTTSLLLRDENSPAWQINILYCIWGTVRIQHQRTWLGRVTRPCTMVTAAIAIAIAHYAETGVEDTMVAGEVAGIRDGWSLLLQWGRLNRLLRATRARRGLRTWHISWIVVLHFGTYYRLGG